jgi:tRNA threonylcarbamoyladenosine biosynthesis protein TsaB
MILIAIDTSTPKTSVGIGTESGIVAELTLSGKGRQESLPLELDHLCRWSDIELGQVGGIAVGLGPGLFTGLRVGVQTAKTLAQVLGVPIVGISSLDAVAFAVRHVSRSIAAVVDARRGEVFWSLYEPVPGGVMRTREHEVTSPAKLSAELEAVRREVLCVGDGAILYRYELSAAGPSLEFASASVGYPRASCLLELAVPRFLREEFDKPHRVVPIYLRKTDAEIAWDERNRGASA